MAFNIILFLLHAGLQNLLHYAKGCLEFKNFFECIEVCDLILKAEEDQSILSIMIYSKITKGKARFYSYKRKLYYILVNANIRETKEGRLVLKDCFDSMKDAITLLSNGLDLNVLDEEGSRLLDWAMIDCLSTTNQLDKCNRCLLCRQRRSLLKSHVLPKFFFDSVQPHIWS